MNVTIIIVWHFITGLKLVLLFIIMHIEIHLNNYTVYKIWLLWQFSHIIIIIIIIESLNTIK